MVQRTSSSHKSKSKDMKKRKMWGGADTIPAIVLFTDANFKLFQEALTKAAGLELDYFTKTGSISTAYWKDVKTFKKALLNKLLDKATVAATAAAPAVINLQMVAQQLASAAAGGPHVDEYKKIVDTTILGVLTASAAPAGADPAVAATAEQAAATTMIGALETAADASTNYTPFLADYNIPASAIADIPYTGMTTFTADQIKNGFAAVEALIWKPTPDYNSNISTDIVAGIFDNGSLQILNGSVVDKKISLTTKFNVSGQGVANITYVIVGKDTLLTESKVDTQERAPGWTGRVFKRKISQSVSLEDIAKKIKGEVINKLTSVQHRPETKNKLYPMLVAAKVLGEVNKDLLNTELISTKDQDGLFKEDVKTVIDNPKDYVLYHLLTNLTATTTPSDAASTAVNTQINTVKALLTPGTPAPATPLDIDILEKLIVQIKYAMLLRQAEILVAIAKVLRDAEMTGGKKQQKGGFQDMDASKIYNAQGLVSDLSKMFESNVITNADAFPAPFSAGGITASSEGLSKDFSDAITADITPKYQQTGGAKKRTGNRRYNSCGM